MQQKYLQARMNHAVWLVVMLISCAWGYHTDRANRPVDLWKYYQHGIVDYTAAVIPWSGLFGTGQTPSAWLNASETINTPYKTSSQPAFVISGYKGSFTFGNALPITMSLVQGKTIRFYLWMKHTTGTAGAVFSVRNSGGTQLTTGAITLESMLCDAAATRPWYCDYVDIAIPSDAASIYLTLWNNRDGDSGRNGTSYLSTLSWELVTATNTYSTAEKQDPWTGGSPSLSTPYYRRFAENLRAGYNYGPYVWNFWRGPAIGIYGVEYDMTTKAGISNWYHNVSPYVYEDRNHGVMYVASRYWYGLDYGTLPPMESGWLTYFADMVIADQDATTGYWGWSGAPKSMAITFHISDGLFNYYSNPRPDREDTFNDHRYLGPGYEEQPLSRKIIETTLSLQSTYVDEFGQTRWAAWCRNAYNWTSSPNFYSDKCWLASTSNAIWMSCRLKRFVSQDLQDQLYERVKAAVYYTLKYCVRDDGVWLQWDLDDEPTISDFMRHIVEESNYLERRMMDLASPSAGLYIEQNTVRVVWHDPAEEQNSLRVYAVPSGMAASEINESYLLGVIQRTGNKIYTMDPFLAVRKMSDGAIAYWGSSAGWTDTTGYLGWKLNTLICWPLAHTFYARPLTLTLSAIQDKDIYASAATWYGEESAPVLLPKQLVVPLPGDFNDDHLCNLTDLAALASLWQKCLETTDLGTGCD